MIADTGLIFPIGYITATMDLMAIGTGHIIVLVGAVRPVLEWSVIVTLQTELISGLNEKGRLITLMRIMAIDAGSFSSGMGVF